MQNFFIHVGEVLLACATLGIVAVLGLERMLTNRRSKPKTTSQSFLEIIKPKPSFLDVINRTQPNGEVPSHIISPNHIACKAPTPYGGGTGWGGHSGDAECNRSRADGRDR